MRAFRLFSRWAPIFVLTATFLATIPTHAADATFYAVIKGQKFDQTDAGPPVLGSGTPFRFNAIVGLSASNTITNATVQSLPSGPVNTLVAGSGTLEFQDKFATMSELDAAYANGNYKMVIDAVHDGTRILTLPLNGNTYPGAAPHISNFAGAQAINPGIPFTLTWDPLSGGTTNDFVQLIVENYSGTIFFQSPEPGQAGSLNGTSTSVVIPAGRLPALTALFAEVLFGKVVSIDTNSYPGTFGDAGYVKQTEFNIATTNSTPAQDVTAYSIFKQENFVEDSGGGLSPDPAGASRFVAFLAPKGFNGTTLSNASLQLPNGSSHPLTFSTTWFLLQSFSSEGALETAFPPGIYNITYNGVHDGFQSLPLTVPTNSFPSAPHVNNLPAAQTIDPTTSFKLTWDPIPGFIAGDTLILVIADSRGTNVVTSGLTIGATNYTISANALQTGQTYQGSLLFSQLANSVLGTLPGVSGSVYFKAQTTFHITTVGTTGSFPKPQLVALLPNGSGQFQFQLLGQTNQLYAIDGSTNLQLGIWVPLTTNMASGGQFVFHDSQSSNFPVRFYRGRLVQ